MKQLLNRKRFVLIYLILTISISFIPAKSYGQIAEDSSDSTRLKLYLDCRDCDFAYFRRNLPYVDFVRDQKIGDIHLMVTEQRTASGGRSYGFNFIGKGDYTDLNYKLNTSTQQTDTDIQVWNKLLSVTNMGLMPYISRTAESYNIRLSYDKDSIALKEEIGGEDQWDYWVFRLSLGSDAEIEESQKEYSINTSLRVDRITETLKFRSDIMYDRAVETYIDKDTTIEGLRNFMDSDLELVYSLGPRWSVGVFNEFRSSTFDNVKFSSRTGPAIEYNIFPWDISDRKIFSFGYHVQFHYFDYHALTIYNMLYEQRMSQSLRLSLILRQPWGEVETRLEGSHYFHDLSKNRLTLDSRLSVNITKGLSIYTELYTALIHDQLNLPAGEISREDLLLKQQQLATAYRFNAEFGISFTFGSIYNNIVNQRL